MEDNQKKVLTILIILVVVLTSFFLILRMVRKGFGGSKKTSQIVVEEEKAEDSSLEGLIDSSRLVGGLPVNDEKINIGFYGETNNDFIEYISFSDFYKKISDDPQFEVHDYELPINIKTDVLNYYDFSRRINLDKHVEALNKDGVVVIDNVFSVNNFYNIYNELNQRNLPFLISSDFLIYYYQQTLKNIFKNIEEEVFYANLWDINKILFNRSKSRYEDSWRQKGTVNDRVLEAQRLALAYYAVSLELLKPDESQINPNNDIGDKSSFTPFEADSYFFALPDYLKVDVEKEVELIRSAKKTQKSPVLSYEQDYREFLVPSEYQQQARLNNFYLCTKWLSSLFPLYYQGNDCPDCYLDFDDWKVNLISSAFIAEDIFDNYELKNKWARIYKTLAFFKGLRGELTYVHYRDALLSLFGEDYQIEDIFAEDNPEAINNFYAFRNKILEYEFLDIEGAFNRQDLKERTKIGARMLVDFYWPNDSILGKLSHPQVGPYQGDVSKKSLATNNVTSCRLNKNEEFYRCNGFSLDIIALINEASLLGNEYFLENSKYQAYQENLQLLKNQINKYGAIWHYNNYWKTLNLIKEYLQSDKNKLPSFSRNLTWRRQELVTSIGAWINLQLPVEPLSVYKKYQSTSDLINDSVFSEHNYIEPNLNLINEQLANINMISEMFRLLKINQDLRLSFLELENLKENLTDVKKIMIKELKGDILSEEDRRFIHGLALSFKLEEEKAKTLELVGKNNTKIKYDLSSTKLKILFYSNGDDRVLVVGPVFSYTESR